MKTIYMGHNPGYAKVCNDETELLAVFWHSSEGNISKRTNIMLDYCKQKNILAIQHSKLTEEIKQKVISLKPDLIIVGEYHFILKRDFFEIPKYGTINLHGAPLPRYRGANPINWMIINGETEGAVTCHYISDGLDNGDIIAQYKFPIRETETAYDIRPKIEDTGLKLLRDVLNKFKIKGKIVGIPQDETKSLYTPPRKPEDGIIDWNKSPKQIYNFVRALTKPYPGAFTFLKNKKIYIWKVEFPTEKNINKNNYIKPGMIIDKWNTGFKISVKDGSVNVLDWENNDDANIKIMDILTDIKGE